MNEAIFLLHTLLLLGAIFGAQRLGKEALVTLIALCVVMANLFVLKQIVLFHLQVTCADLYAVGGMIALNLLREFHGPKIARQVIWISFGAAMLFTLFSLVQIVYKPSSGDWAHTSFVTLLTPVPRLMAASLGVYFIVQRLDLWLFERLKKSLPLGVRTAVCVSISQLIDTVLFSFLALAGLVESIFSIIVVSYAIKLVALALMTPLTLLAKRWQRDVSV